MRQQFGDARAALQSFLSAGGSTLVFRSNVTPEITIDIANLVSSSPSPSAVSSKDRTALGLIQPELVVSSLGVEKSYAPYGRPSPNFYLNILFVAGVAGVLGAGIAWRFCRKN